MNERGFLGGRPMYWVLDGKTPVPSSDVWAYARLFENDGNRVAWTEEDDWAVSTIFLGLDHSFGYGGPPILFETMITGVSAEYEWTHQTRYSTWREAEEGHELAVEWARSVVALAKEKAGAALAGAASAKE